MRVAAQGPGAVRGSREKGPEKRGHHGQDMSQERANLIKALLTQVPDCKLFAVGDDWQSIYRFARCLHAVREAFRRYCHELSDATL
jgi:UvrD/REP helicase N-terminal domain